MDDVMISIRLLTTRQIGEMEDAHPQLFGRDWRDKRASTDHSAHNSPSDIFKRISGVEVRVLHISRMSGLRTLLFDVRRRDLIQRYRTVSIHIYLLQQVTKQLQMGLWRRPHPKTQKKMGRNGT